MFRTKGFHVSASGAIQDHHGSLVKIATFFSAVQYIYCYEEQKRPLILASLDALKAFDTVNHEILFKVPTAAN